MDNTTKMVNKVPMVTLFFWIIKILATTVGETAADYLNVTLGLGLSVTSYIYETNFKTDGKTMPALYDENGNRQETEADINISNLPAAVTNYISQNYKGEWES